MEKADIKISYDKDHNMFSLFRKDSKAKFSFDIELPKGDIILDFDFKGHIIGIEFFNASSYIPQLERLDINKLSASMNIQYGPNWAQVSYEISSPELKKSLSNTVISPYSRKLILEN